MSNITFWLEVVVIALALYGLVELLNKLISKIFCSLF